MQGINKAISYQVFIMEVTMRELVAVAGFSGGECESYSDKLVAVAVFSYSGT